jgi:hypothetical protein
LNLWQSQWPAAAEWDPKPWLWVYLGIHAALSGTKLKDIMDITI